jgi:hypothetical protein
VPSAVPPRRCFFVEPASVRQAAKESQVRAATTLAFSSSALEAHVAARSIAARKDNALLSTVNTSIWE